MSAVGFCSGCGLVRQDSEDGVPETECACMVKHHTEDCAYRRAVSCAIGFPCDKHDLEVCPDCDACTCGANDNIKFRASAPPRDAEKPAGYKESHG